MGSVPTISDKRGSPVLVQIQLSKLDNLAIMVRICSVPGRNNRSDKQSDLSYFRLPLKDKLLQRKWVQNIGRADLPLTANTTVCSVHFVAGKKKLKSDIPELELPQVPIHI